MNGRIIKRAQIGPFLTLFFATIIIGLLLGILIASSLIRSLDGSEAGVRVSKEGSFGIYDIEEYARNNYSSIVRLRVIRLGVFDSGGVENDG